MTPPGIAVTQYGCMTGAGPDALRAATLIARIAQGDREAFERFYDAYAGLAFGLIQRVLRDSAAAEDVLQEVFWQVWQEARTYDAGRGSPEAWVVMRAKTRAIDRLRSMRRRDKTFVAPMEEGLSPVAGVSEENPGVLAEERRAIESALGRLPGPQRQVIELAFFQGMTQSEIATRLGEPLGTVKTRARMGLERLRGLFKEEGFPAT